MSLIWTLTLLFSLDSHAGSSQLSELNQIKHAIGKNAVEQYLQHPTDAGISSEYLEALIEDAPKTDCSMTQSTPTPTPEPLASASPTATPKKTTHMEVLLITETSTAPQASAEFLSNKGIYTSTTTRNRIQDAAEEVGEFKPTNNALNFNEVQTYANELSMEAAKSECPKCTGTLLQQKMQKYYKAAMVETMILSVPRMPGTSDAQLSQQFAKIISQMSNSDEDKYNYLAMLSDRLYDNYNEARNPGSNNSENNPDNEKLPSGHISSYEIFKAAALDDVANGGVCNDISQAIAGVGEYLFPDKDVLTINGGSHFGVIITDGKNTRVIDGLDQLVTKNQTVLLPDYGVTSTRISKLYNGKLREIAVVDTQLGQLLNTAYGLDRPLLKTAPNISDVFASTKLVMEKNAKKRKELSLTGGRGKLSNSIVDVVVLKYDVVSDKAHSYVGFAGLNQNFGTLNTPQTSIDLKAGFDRRFFRYISPKIKVNYTAGVHFDAMASMRDQVLDTDGIAASLETANKIDFQTQNKKTNALKFSGDAQLRNSFGPSDWGATTGATSKITFPGVVRAIGDLDLHLNQVVVNLNADKPVTKKMSIQTKGMYQGTNIGQAASLITGVKWNYPAGAELYLFTGVETSAIKGYQTKHSLLVGPQGGKVGAELKTKNGNNVGAQVQGIGSQAGPQVNATAKITIERFKKKKKPKSQLSP